jgi:tetratricopeptide (TPR) repeat protein
MKSLSHRSHRRKTLALLLCVATTSGCALLSTTDKGQAETQSQSSLIQRLVTRANNDNAPEPRVANPLATTIRFEGQELVLGNGEFRNLPIDALQQKIRELIEQKKYRSAKNFIANHRYSARRWILRDWSKLPHDPAITLAAQTLDSFSQTRIHSDLLALAVNDKAASRSFAELSESCYASLQRQDKKPSPVAELSAAAKSLKHPLLEIEAARISGMIFLLNDSIDQAINAFSQGAQSAQQHQLLDSSAEFALMACDANMQQENLPAAAEAWRSAVRLKLSAIVFGSGTHSLPDVDPVFWEQAAKFKPHDEKWPLEVNNALSPWSHKLNVSAIDETSCETVLWSSIGQHQMLTGQYELALIALKRADLSASKPNQLWLRIAQARCLAAQGQTSLAMTLLSDPAASDDPKIRVAATATIGSIKLHSGAFEQGAEILNKVLVTHPNVEWSGRLDAEADVANAQLILGDLNSALDQLHAVQRKYQLAGRWYSLIMALENEANILDAEGMKDRAEGVRKRIGEIEQG